MAMAVRRLPVKSTVMASMVRSNSLPLSTVGWPGLVSAQTGWRQSPRPAKAPPAARLLTKVRLELINCMLVLLVDGRSERAHRYAEGVRHNVILGRAC